jgi:hypothetical protein
MPDTETQACDHYPMEFIQECEARAAPPHFALDKERFTCVR